MIERMIDRKKEIIKILENYPEGLHFSRLFRMCKAFTSRATLIKLLRELEEDSNVFRTPRNPRKGEKVYYQLTESFTKFQEKLKSLDEQRDVILNYIYMLHYCLEKGYVKNNSLVVDFIKSLFDQFLVLFIKANNLGRSFPEKYRSRFYEQAFEIFTNANLRHFSILEDYPELSYVGFELRSPKIFLNSNKFYDDYLNWLKKSDDNDYRRIGLFNEKQIREFDSARL
jgi:DNA-binding HxlR family transcriptional regulator